MSIVAGGRNRHDACYSRLDDEGNNSRVTAICYRFAWTSRFTGLAVFGKAGADPPAVACFPMTPLSRLLSRHFTAAAIPPVLAIVYAVLIGYVVLHIGDQAKPSIYVNVYRY